MTRPKGTLVAVGGAGDAHDDVTVLRRVVREVGSRRVEVIAADAAGAYLRALEAVGVRRVDALRVASRQEAEDARIVARLREADVVCFAGGDHARLAEAFRGTRALHVIRERYHEGAVVAGAGAGAAAMSEAMLAPGADATDEGLGLLPRTVIGTQAGARGTFGRLIGAVARSPRLVGLGVGEGTALVVRDGRRVDVVGPDSVLVVDRRDAPGDDAEAGDATPPERLVVHALPEGYSFDLESHTFLAPKHTENDNQKVNP